MTIHIYKKGQKVRCDVTFKVADVLTDPSAVTARVKSPNGTIVTYVYLTDAALVKDSTGAYHVDVTTTENGEWHFRFEGTGVCTAVEEAAFQVRSVFP
jgi:uncharacterized protein YfaS (alpha-2-macroglobulin family)